jgi:hypothetical protein
MNAALSNGPIEDEAPTINPKDQCHFSLPGHHPLLSTPPADPQAVLRDGPISDKATSSASIPTSAWPHISSILAKLTTDKQNIMQTWDLGRALSDATLEGIMLGVVYSPAPAPAVAGKGENSRVKVKARLEEGASIPKSPMNGMEFETNKRFRRECVEGAVQEVETRQQMEGVMDVAADETGNGGARVSFLVYRVD